MDELRGKVALVAGASRAAGRAIAVRADRLVSKDKPADATGYR